MYSVRPTSGGSVQQTSFPISGGKAFTKGRNFTTESTNFGARWHSHVGRRADSPGGVTGVSEYPQATGEGPR